MTEAGAKLVNRAAMTTEDPPPDDEDAPPAVPFRWRLAIQAALWMAAGLVIAIFYKEHGDYDGTEFENRVWTSIFMPAVVCVGFESSVLLALKGSAALAQDLTWSLLLLPLFAVHAYFMLATRRRRTFVILSVLLAVVLSISVFGALRHAEYLASLWTH